MNNFLYGLKNKYRDFLLNRKVYKAIKKDKIPEFWTWNFNFTLAWILDEGLKEFKSKTKKQEKIKELDSIIEVFDKYREEPYEVSQEEIDKAFKLLSKIFFKLWY